MEYTIKLDGTKVGQAQIEKQGLFYCIVCRCTFPDSAQYHIILQTESGNTDLGLCDTDHPVTRRVSIKKTGDGTLTFHAVPTAERMIVHPVVEGEVFPYLSKLHYARLERRDEKFYIQITDPDPGKPGSDRNL